MFTYISTDSDGETQSHQFSAPCHSETPPLVAYAYFTDLISNEKELQDVQGLHDDIIPPSDLFDFRDTPRQMMSTIQHETTIQEAAKVRLQKEVRDTDQARRDNAATRLGEVLSLSLPALQPIAKWQGEIMYNAFPINTTTRRMDLNSTRSGLHVLELFGGIGLGALRSALAAGFSIRCYTYIDKDPISQRIAKQVLQQLQVEYPSLLPKTAIIAFDKRLPQSVECVSDVLLGQLITRHGPVDLLGGSWECQSISQAGKQKGAEDSRFRYFFNLVNIINYLQREQTQPFIYILENTYPGERCTTGVIKAGHSVQSFIGAPIIIDAADLGAAAHKVRLFWTNFIEPSLLSAALPKKTLPDPTLIQILHHRHLPTLPGHDDRFPFAQHNRVGSPRLCMPAIVSYLGSNAFRTKDNGNP